MKKLFLISGLFLTTISANVFGVGMEPINGDHWALGGGLDVPETLTIPLNNFISYVAEQLKINIIGCKELDKANLTYPTWISTKISAAGEKDASPELRKACLQFLTDFFRKIGYQFKEVDGIYRVIKE
jgi:hypothetical protein